MTRTYNYNIKKDSQLIRGNIWDKYRIIQKEKAWTFYSLSVVLILGGIFLTWIFENFKILFWAFVASVGSALLGRYFMDSSNARNKRYG